MALIPLKISYPTDAPFPFQEYMGKSSFMGLVLRNPGPVWQLTLPQAMRGKK